MSTISEQCRHIAKLLAAQGRRIVFAESCTAGMVAASLGRVPGISNYLCGSAVTYRDETKAAWLKIPRPILESSGSVSESVARLMAHKALAITPEADLAISVTGHLGPDAPPKLDGLIFIGRAVRGKKESSTAVQRRRLKTSSRAARQREATQLVLAFVRKTLAEG